MFESVCARRRAGAGCGVATRLGGSRLRRDGAFVSASTAVLLPPPLLMLLSMDDTPNSALAIGGEGCRSVDFFLWFKGRCLGRVSGAGSVSVLAGGDEGRLEGGDG
jgi:hypothetical protein